jgi:hypothetical protein
MDVKANPTDRFHVFHFFLSFFQGARNFSYTYTYVEKLKARSVIPVHFWNLEQPSTEKAGIHPTYHEPFQEVVTSPLPAPLGAEQNFCISVLVRLSGLFTSVPHGAVWFNG